MPYPSLQRGDRAACRKCPDNVNIEHNTSFDVQNDIRSAHAILESKSRGIDLNPPPIGPQHGGDDTGHRSSSLFGGQWTQVEFRQNSVHFVASWAGFPGALDFFPQ